MSYAEIWDSLPTDLRKRLLANPDMVVTSQTDFLALTRHGLTIVATYWVSTTAESAPQEWHLTPDFRRFVQEQSKESQ